MAFCPVSSTLPPLPQNRVHVSSSSISCCGCIKIYLTMRRRRVGLGRLGCKQASTFLPLPLRYPMTTSSSPHCGGFKNVFLGGWKAPPHTPLFCWAAGHSTLRHPFFLDNTRGERRWGCFHREGKGCPTGLPYF